MGLRVALEGVCRSHHGLISWHKREGIFQVFPTERQTLGAQLLDKAHFPEGRGVLGCKASAVFLLYQGGL